MPQRDLTPAIRPPRLSQTSVIASRENRRQNRQILLRPDVTVGGVGFAEHAEYGSIATITLVGLFATALNEPRTVECDTGRATKALTEVLDAIPSAELRTRVLDAIADNKKVKVEYAVTSATITTMEPDGTGQAVTFKWE